MNSISHPISNPSPPVQGQLVRREAVMADDPLESSRGKSGAAAVHNCRGVLQVHMAARSGRRNIAKVRYGPVATGS